MAEKLLIYIHGFLSSPLSLKAEETRNFLAEQFFAEDRPQIDFLAPQLANFPDQAYAQLIDVIHAAQVKHKTIGLIGSSLGGFFATALAEQFNLRAVLVNPAVNPARHRFLARYQGEQCNPYTGEKFVLDDSHRQALAAIHQASLSRPENLWLMAQTGDDVLDYREAVAYYAQSPQLVEAGGDHRFQQFHRHLPAAIDFLFS